MHKQGTPMATLIDHCSYLMPNVLTGSSILQQDQKGNIVFNPFFFISPRQSTNNVNIFFRNNTIFQGLAHSLKNLLASRCGSHVSQCLSLGSESTQRADFSGCWAVVKLPDLGKSCLMNIELTPQHSSIFYSDL